ncbi:hypothetical protein PUN28_012831 [Cardiocondyla obscurior]|uniref:Uncharacterized protein n=1 Tax=Cardiocondyla obscurior TaxID=286306 RepID=A0AAW2F5K6_9HYME
MHLVLNKKKKNYICDERGIILCNIVATFKREPIKKKIISRCEDTWVITRSASIRDGIDFSINHVFIILYTYMSF